jgi:hypothetical protein
VNQERESQFRQRTLCLGHGETSADACWTGANVLAPARCREFVSHRYRLNDTDAAVQKAIAPDSMKVVIDPWA